MTPPQASTKVECACCGGSFEPSEVVGLHGRPDTVLCGPCIGWLADRRSRVMPVLATDDVPASTAFWSSAGFELEHFAQDFVIAQRFGLELHLVRANRYERPGGGCYLHLASVDEVHAEWKAAGLPVSEVRDEPHGMREFSVTDPGRNHIRVGQNIEPGPGDHVRV
jgi:hypothetical protein